jgi:hypothetical protein
MFTLEIGLDPKTTMAATVPHLKTFSRLQLITASVDLIEIQ